MTLDSLDDLEDGSSERVAITGEHGPEPGSEVVVVCLYLRALVRTVVSLVVKIVMK